MEKQNLEEAIKNNSKTFSFANEQLTLLPFKMRGFTSLESLNLSRNLLTAFQPWIKNLTNLQEINISYNRFSELPQEFLSLKNLKSLNLSFNQFEMVPEVVVKIQTLEKLSFKGNFIVCIRQEIINMINLTELDFSKNQIMEIPNFEKIRSLKKLNLDENPLLGSISQLLRTIHQRTKEQVIEKVEQITEEKIEEKSQENSGIINEKRFFAVAEILESEKKYLKYLDFLKSFYHSFYNEEIEKELKISKEKLIKTLPNGLEDILKFNQELVTELSKIIDPKNKSQTINVCLGEIFIERSPYLKLYLNFISEYSECTLKIKEYSKDYPLFKEYLEKKSNEPDAYGLFLNSFLIMPIQRIPRYVLLLKAVLEYTPSNHLDYEKLKIAITKVSEVSSYINSKMDEISSKNIAQQLTVELNLEFNSKRLFFKEGNINEKNGNVYSCYLFNDLILLRKSGLFGLLNQDIICKLSDCKVEIDKEKKEIHLKDDSNEWTFNDPLWIKAFEKLSIKS